MPREIKWTKFYLDLPKRQRRFVNNFCMSCEGYSELTNMSNWNMDCNLYGFTSLIGKFEDAFKRYKAAGYLPE